MAAGTWSEQPNGRSDTAWRSAHMKAAESTGKYISLTGTVVMIDPVYRELKVMQDSDRKAVGIEKELPVIIPFDDIADLAGEGITSIEDYLGIEKYPDDI